MSDNEVLNNDNQLIGRVMIHNVSDGVLVQLIYVGGAVSNLAFITGANVSKTITVGLKRRPGGRVAEVKR